MTWLPSRLGVRLFFSFLLVILIGMLVLFLTSRFTTPSAYRHHLLYMEGQLGGMGMMGGGQGPRAGPGMMSGFYEDFQASFNESLLIAAAIATLAAVSVSLLLSRGITSKLRAMMAASRRISQGDYAERVPVVGNDELAELSGQFNEMAARLEQVEAMRRRLIGDVAHELRTPLTAIKGSMEGLMDGVLPSTPETFEQIQQEAERLNRLVDDLQELSRVEAGAYELELHAVELSPLLETVIRRFSRLFDEKKIALLYSPPPASIRVTADVGRVEQVLTNLLANALRYTPEGGSVSLKLETVGPMAQVSITDTGIGIPAEHLEHIFDRFYRVEKSRSRAGGGSGIGLTIARHLVESHGGRIRAESEGEGRGARFVFTLPLAR
ncbi:MAG: sensor histidine kinase [Bacteroidota bacterium]